MFFKGQWPTCTCHSFTKAKNTAPIPHDSRHNLSAKPSRPLATKITKILLFTPPRRLKESSYVRNAGDREGEWEKEEWERERERGGGGESGPWESSGSGTGSGPAISVCRTCSHNAISRCQRTVRPPWRPRHHPIRLCCLWLHPQDLLICTTRGRTRWNTKNADINKVGHWATDAMIQVAAHFPHHNRLVSHSPCPSTLPLTNSITTHTQLNAYSHKTHRRTLPTRKK